ncbi:outer membrane protein assembly factor [Granulicella sp. S156]|uniref:POTRA domain-containing protein n=1 Tax=Granulicella sp. S156 TaxID=1747224 RepID=UPI0020B1074A|nr:outer membrane protein assembly factor [Granulicella sp. S156]
MASVSLLAGAHAQTSTDPVNPAAPTTTAPQAGTSVNNTLPALTTSVWEKSGVPVEAIRFDGVTFSAKDAILSELTQKAGQPLDPEKVRADLRRLFASGRYRDVGVSGVTTGGGLTLIYAGTARYYVGRVEIHGVNQERLTSLLEFATKLDPGSPYTEAQIPAAVEGVKQTLAQNGFYQPTVKVATTTDNDGHQINAIFTVETGPQARVGDVAVGGKDPGITVDEFRKKGHLNCSRIAAKFNKSCRPKVGRETTSNALSDVRSYYQKQDRLEATVSLQGQTYVAPTKRLNYDFNAEQGPLVKVVVNGVKLSKSRMHLLVPVFEEGAVDNDLLNEGASNIRDYLQQQGYFDAQATVQLLGAGTSNVSVQYDVKPGERHKVTAVTLKGTKYFGTDLIEERLRVKKADAYLRNGSYSTQLVKADTNSIVSLYRANGFNAAMVTPEVKDIEKGQNSKIAQIRVTFNIFEGAQQKFGTVQLTGIDPARQKDVQSLLNAQKGQPFSLITLSGDRDAVLGYYISHGFDHARVEIVQNIEDADKTRTNVALNVTEGQQVFIDQVLLSGLGHTKPSVVQKQLTVHAGGPLDQSALLETQRKLYNLALFNEVNADVQNPTGDAPMKNVLVQLTEARRWDVTYGFGFEAQTGTPDVNTGATQGSTAAQNGEAGVSPRVTLDISRINLRGTTQSLTLHTTYGLLEKVATLSLNTPQFLGKPKYTATLSGGYSNVQDITTFQSSTLQGDFRISQKFRKADTFIYDFQYRRVSVNADSLEITPNLIPLLSEPVRVGGPAITYVHDTRDPTPLNAGKGTYFSIQEFIASSKFGSDTDFNKVDISQSTYYTFGKRKYVFARNTRVGFENDFGVNPNATNASGQIDVSNTACAGTLLQTNATCNAVPLPERLYAGGATSHRGFGINDAGPRDLTTGYPVGGSGVVVNTFELRLPPPTLPLVGDNISFVIFHDMGNVFEYPGDMFKSIKHFHQPNQQTCRNVTIPAGTPGATEVEQQANAVGTCNFNYYSHAVGLGVRYKTPVGPIRVDFSYNLNPPIYPVFDDYTGALPYVGQASHFNFFFSIGQSF